MSKTFAEHIEALKATREDKTGKQKSIAQAAMDEARSMDEAEQAEFDTLTDEIKRLDEDVARFARLEAADKKTAAPVQETKAAPSGVDTFRVKNTQKLEPGIAFSRLARVKAVAHLGLLDGERSHQRVAEMLYPDDENVVKAAVPAANTGTAAWAGDLVADRGGFADFVEYLQPRTLYGQISGSFRALPFDTPVLIQTAGGSANWVKEGAAKPMTKWSYTQAKLTPLKVAALAAATKETLMRSSAAADALIREELTRSIGRAIDTQLVSASQGSSDESPDGLRYNVSAVSVSGGGDIEDIRKDMALMINKLVGDNLTVSGAYWLMPETLAVTLSLMANEIGAVAFPGITPLGGTLAGLPVYTSQHMPVSTSGSVVMLVKGDEIFKGDEGGLQVSVSDQATIEMVDTSPTGDSVTPAAGTDYVSLWQTNSVGFLVERFLNWQKRQNGAVAWATVSWGETN